MRIWKKIKKDDLLRHSSLLFSSMMVVHISNIGFQMVVGRKLLKQEYALLSAFLAALMIIRRPLGTLRAALSRYSSLLEQEGRRGDVKRLLRKWLFLPALPSMGVGALVVVFSVPLAGFFHLNRPAPVIIAGMLLPALCWLPVLSGVAQGLQLFRWTSLSMIVGALVRLGLGAGFTAILYRACGWAMLGHGLSLYVTAAGLFVGLWLTLHRKEVTAMPLPSLRGYLFYSFFIQAAFAVLMTSDVVLVSHYLPEDHEFSYAATLGRLVAFLPGAIVTAMFPMVASKGAMNKKQRKVFFRSWWYSALFVSAAILGFALMPDIIRKILYGKKVFSLQISQTILWMSIVMGLSAMLNVNVQLLLAQQRFEACIVIMVCAVGYLLSAWFFHDHSWQIIVAAAVTNAVSLIVTGISILRQPVDEVPDC
jgi:O-antigen/teichoic acid export membrane protein